MRRCFVTSLVAAGIVWGLPGAALAQENTLAPPGNGAIDEYSETLPAPGGGQPTDRPGGQGAPGGVGGSSVVPAPVQRRLRRSGPDGAQAAAVAELTAPGGGGGPAAGSRKPRGGHGAVRGETAESPAPAGASIPSQVERALGGSDGGMGAALPVILGLSLVVAVGAGVARRRRHGDAEPSS
jgi:hypothetical protein